MSKSGTLHQMPRPSFIVSGALEAYRFVKQTAKNTIAVCADAASYCFGVSVDGVETNQTHIAIQAEGFALVEASAAIAFGAKVTATTDGKAIATTTAGDLVYGIATEAAGADGEKIQIRLIQPVEYSTIDAA